MSTVTGRVSDIGLSFPAGSVKLYANVCGPSDRGVVGVSVPVTGSYVAGTFTPSTYSDGVSPAGTVPIFNPGVLSSVVGAELVGLVNVPASSA